MKQVAQNTTKKEARQDDSQRRLRPVDGFVVGGEAEWETAQNLWLLVSRPGERLIDFFVEDEAGEQWCDPAPWTCGGVLPDGTLLIGTVDWELDRFLSEMLDEHEAASAR